MNTYLDALTWNEHGLVPVIAQEQSSGDVLMLAWMDRAALAQTLQTGFATYYSRSRQKWWQKGEQSGHIQRVHRIRLDCDGDALLLDVTQEGHVPSIACHTGRHSCFYQVLVQAEQGEPIWQTQSCVLKEPSDMYGVE
jgi:phosphoribosyl-AMP cyclohydrolase